MSDDLRGLPPRRALPDDVRDRLRAEVRQGVQGNRKRGVRYAAAAAAVLVLAAGAVVVTREARRPVETPPAATGGLTLDAALATSTLDRCWAAVLTAGKTGQVPPRAEWVPLFTEVEAADAVVAATAAGRPMFCETTDTTVTLSDPAAEPAYVPGTRSGLLLHSATGLVGGVVDPGWRKADLGTRTDGGDTSSQNLHFSPVSHQFTVLTRTDPARTRLTIGNPAVPSSAPLPAAPPPLLSVADRPDPADRTSDAGRALGGCLADAEEVIPDAVGYRPGPLLEADGLQVVLGRRGDRVVACTREPGPGTTGARTYPDLFGNRRGPARTLGVNTLGAAEAGGEPGKSRNPFAAALPVTATGATIDFGTGTSTEIQVVDGMALTWIPKTVAITSDAKAHIRARDARGGIVYDGSLPLF